MATTFFISSGLAVIDDHRSHLAQADRVAQAIEIGPAADSHEKVPPNGAGVTRENEQKKAESESFAATTSEGLAKQEARVQSNRRVTRSADQQSTTQKQTATNASDQPVKTNGKQSTEPTATNQPIDSLYDQTALSYERLVNQLGSHDANLSPKGEAALTSDKRYIAQPGQMIFGEPDKRLFGIAGTKNDYSNVSEMRLVVDDAFSKKVIDKVKSLVVTDDKGSDTHYYQNQNTLSMGGGVPFTANIYSSNDSAINPLYYYKMLKSTIDAVANIISIGMVEDKLSANYQQGQYGIYLRVAVPKGVDPNQFIQTLNVDNSRFAAEMNFNATIGLDRLINQIPGLGNLLSKGLGVPVSGNIGGVVDLVLGKTIDQLNQKYGTNLTVRNSDSPFYPITLYPQATKVNLVEDPYGAYLLVRGDDLSHYNSAILQAKILLTKFFMESLSWGAISKVAPMAT